MLIKTLDKSFRFVGAGSAIGTADGVVDLADAVLSEAVSEKVLTLGFLPFNMSLSLSGSSSKST